MCPALEGRVVVVHGDGFSLYDRKKNKKKTDMGRDMANVSVFMKQLDWLTVCDSLMEPSCKLNICPLASDATLGRSLALQD